eukprot:1210279-Prymnesium_polylepis.1
MVGKLKASDVASAAVEGAESASSMARNISIAGEHVRQHLPADAKGGVIAAIDGAQHLFEAVHTAMSLLFGGD